MHLRESDPLINFLSGCSLPPALEHGIPCAMPANPDALPWGQNDCSPSSIEQLNTIANLCDLKFSCLSALNLALGMSCSTCLSCPFTMLGNFWLTLGALLGTLTLRCPRMSTSSPSPLALRTLMGVSLPRRGLSGAWLVSGLCTITVRRRSLCIPMKAPLRTASSWMAPCVFGRLYLGSSAHQRVPRLPQGF